MTFKNTNQVGFLSSFARLNKSSEKYRSIAWRKFGWHVASVLGFDVLVAWILFYSSWIFHGAQDYIPASALFVLAVYLNCRYLGRFIVSWQGFFRNVHWGFFICDRCHRLKPARYLAKEVAEDKRILCGTCEPEAVAMRASMQRIMSSIDDLGRRAGETPSKVYVDRSKESTETVAPKETASPRWPSEARKIVQFRPAPLPENKFKVNVSPKQSLCRTG